MSMNWKPPKGGEVDFSIKKFDAGRTKQSESESCDINKIVARYERTGFLEHVRREPGIFADATGYGDYHEMASKVTAAKQSFMLLPAELRSRFFNDPGRLIAFVADDANREEAIKLGLVSKPAPVKAAGGKPKGGGDPPEPAPAGDGGRPVVPKPRVKKSGGSPPD